MSAVEYNGREFEEEAYKDEEVLRKLYYEKRLSMGSIGDIFDVTMGGIKYWMNKYGMERREVGGGNKPPSVPYMTHKRYPFWSHPPVENDGQYLDVYIHRLLAVAEFGFDAIKDNEVHHGSERGELPASERPWANWGSNVELLSGSVHMRHHNPRTFNKTEAEEIRQRYSNEDILQQELAEEYGVKLNTIDRVINKRRAYSED